MFLVAFLAACPAFAAVSRVESTSFGDMSNCTLSSPALLNTTTTCGGATGVRVRGANSITFIFKYTRGGTATAWSCILESLDDTYGTFVPISTQAVAAGVITISPASIARTSSASAENQYTLNVNADAVRLRCSGTGATAADTLQVQSRIAFTPDS